MTKKQREASLLKQFCQAWSLVPEDAERVLRSPNGQVHTYPRDEHLHKVQLLHLRGQL